MTYSIGVIANVTINVEVEANSVDEAIKKADGLQYSEMEKLPIRIYSTCQVEAEDVIAKTTIAGTPLLEENNFFKVISREEYPIEFAFSNSRTGWLNEDGTVFYNEDGLTNYEFKDANDAFVFFFGYDENKPHLNEKFTYKRSKYIGNREAHPTLDGWCNRMGVRLDEEEDGSSVYTDWEEVLYE